MYASRTELILLHYSCHEKISYQPEFTNRLVKYTFLLPIPYFSIEVKLIFSLSNIDNPRKTNDWYTDNTHMSHGIGIVASQTHLILLWPLDWPFVSISFTASDGNRMNASQFQLDRTTLTCRVVDGRDDFNYISFSSTMFGWYWEPNAAENI